MNGIVQTPDGGYWFATDQGLVSFYYDDFEIWSSYTYKNSPLPSRPSPALLSLCVAPSSGGSRAVSSAATNSFFQSAQTASGQDALWIGANPGIFVLDLETRTWQVANPGIPTGAVTCFLYDQHGVLWCGCNSLLKYDGAWSVFDPVNKDPGGMIEGMMVRTLQEAGDGRLAVHSGYGSYLFDGAQWQSWSGTPSLYPGIPFKTFAIDRSGAYWYGYQDMGVVCALSDNNFRVYTTADSPLPDNHINAIYVDAQNGVWFATDNGVACYQNEPGADVMESIPGLPDNHITCLCRTPDGATWVGTGQGGVARYHQGEWRAYNTYNSEIPFAEILHIAFEPPDILWLVHPTGLTRYQGEQWKYTSWAGLLVPDLYVKLIR